MVLFLNCCAMAQTVESNDFVQKYKELENMLKSNTKNWENENSNAEKWGKNCQANIFSVLDALETTPGWEFCIDMPIKGGLGDKSHLYVKNINTGENNPNYFNHIRLKNISVASCWQWILFYKMINILPYYWHSAYKMSHLVMTDNDFQKIVERISFVPDSVYEKLEEIEDGTISETEYYKIKNTEIKPVRVNVDESNRKAEVVFYSWNDWTGLTEEFFSLKINEDNVVKIEEVNSKTIIDYDCGLIF